MDADFIEKSLIEAALLSNSKILNVFTHKFGEGEGVTTVIALAESHISIHTWPEFKTATIDIYMCGKGRPEIASQYIIEMFKAKEYTEKNIKRGDIR